MPNGKLVELEYNIALFYTGIERSASEILASQNQKTKEDDQAIIERLHGIKKIGLETRRLFEKGDIDTFGELLDQHWQTKKKLSSAISNPVIDEAYDTAIKAGALGGKIMGAGGRRLFHVLLPRHQGQGDPAPHGYGAQVLPLPLRLRRGQNSGQSA